MTATFSSKSKPMIYDSKVKRANALRHIYKRHRHNHHHHRGRHRKKRSVEQIKRTGLPTIERKISSRNVFGAKILGTIDRVGADRKAVQFLNRRMPGDRGGKEHLSNEKQDHKARWNQYTDQTVSLFVLVVVRSILSKIVIYNVEEFCESWKFFS